MVTRTPRKQKLARFDTTPPGEIAFGNVTPTGLCLCVCVRRYVSALVAAIQHPGRACARRPSAFAALKEREEPCTGSAGHTQSRQRRLVYAPFARCVGGSVRWLWRYVRFVATSRGGRGFVHVVSDGDRPGVAVRHESRPKKNANYPLHPSRLHTASRRRQRFVCGLGVRAISDCGPHRLLSDAVYARKLRHVEVRGPWLNCTRCSRLFATDRE